jgi:CheY-like chemotaxis protein
MIEPKIEPAYRIRAPRDTFRILIMDSVAHTEQLKDACKDAGHSVIAAHSIREAFAFLDGTNHADVIVCAAYLEDESMFEFLRRLRKDPVHKTTVFIIMALAPGSTGIRLNSSVEIAGKSLGADAFIHMPVFDAPRLIAEIKTMLPLVPALEVSRLAAEYGTENRR